MWQRQWGGGGCDLGMINDIICNGLKEHGGEEEAQMHNDNSHIVDATRMRAAIKMRVNRFAPAASSGKNA